MRLSSIVSLVVVAASFALAGCAADAEFADDQTEPSVAHSDTNVPSRRDLTKDIAVNGNVSDNYAHPSDSARARIIDPRVADHLDPRVAVIGSGSGADSTDTSKANQEIPGLHHPDP